MDNILPTFKQEILSSCPKLSGEEWDGLKQQLTPIIYKKGATIFPVTQVCKHVLYIDKGIAASENQAKEDFVINRFFKPKDLCSNLESLTYDTFSDDRLFAITPIEGILIPKQVFLAHYYYTENIGVYLRKKILETLLEDKRFISIKTNSDVQSQLAFLQNHYPEVLLETPWKYIAQYIGVTPEWLSRVLKKGN